MCAATLDAEVLSKRVGELVEAIGMQSLAACAVKVPLAVELLGREPAADEGGVSVVHVLSTSHVAIHTWPEFRFFNLDVFSCRAFELEPVFSWLRSTLGTRAYGASSWRR